ncbi:ABC transporter ATP-binding protein [Qingshengfaniella alkalisoli]|uniref:ABC transporter ATP-binding protein n=1 Tax=Qingshengfaniella alkalisoli TaxID=2599296 RepID=A0A5B8I9V1_9RHOB|nr:ABC transporter ATP-binding protein [Qingshengfaniella alkalisoli]QDY70769.1 ABC transporter ATP-binding protein [Qingshengfaniella alkalisoli]
MTEPLLKVRNLSKVFPTRAGEVHAVRDVSFDVPKGAIVGLVGESGSGKTTLGRCLLRLVEPTSGSAEFDGTELTTLDGRAMKAMRKRMQIIFQDPFSSLNPRMRVKDIIGEALIAHKIGSSTGDRRDRVAALLEEVGLSAEHMNRFPHEFSGGQRQRIGIARALAVDPEFIVADESVSALDVSVQAQILNLMLELRERRGLTILFIAHDLSVVEYLCDEIIVLYLGRVMEAGGNRKVYDTPAHPYTRALLSAAPIPDPDRRAERVVLTGELPSPLAPPPGCVFHTRCNFANDGCHATEPKLQRAGPAQSAACLRLGEI